MQLQQLIGLSSCQFIKVGHYSSGPAGSSGLSCGIRLTPLGVRGRQLILCQIVKETKYLVAMEVHLLVIE